MKLNRVVVTGYGLTSPIGNTPEEFWNSLKNGKIGIGEITKFDHSAFDVHNAAEINDFTTSACTIFARKSFILQHRMVYWPSKC